MPMLMISIAILLHIGTIGIQHIFHRDSIHYSDHLEYHSRVSVNRDAIPISIVKMQRDSVLIEMDHVVPNKMIGNRVVPHRQIKPQPM